MKIDTVLQNTFSNAFSWMKLHGFRSGCHWSLVPMDRINNIPALVQKMAWRWPATSYYLNQWWLIYWRIHASLALIELTPYVLNTCVGGQHRFAISITCRHWCGAYHFSDVIMSTLVSKITALSTVCPAVCSSVHQRKHQSSTSLALWGECTSDLWIPFT